MCSSDLILSFGLNLLIGEAFLPLGLIGEKFSSFSSSSIGTSSFSSLNFFMPKTVSFSYYRFISPFLSLKLGP